MSKKLKPLLAVSSKLKQYVTLGASKKA